jgi:hypothetical protein
MPLRMANLFSKRPIKRHRKALASGHAKHILRFASRHAPAELGLFFYIALKVVIESLHYIREMRFGESTLRMYIGVIY